MSLWLSGWVLLVFMLLGLAISLPLLVAGQGVALNWQGWLSGQSQNEVARALDEHWSSRREWALPRRIAEWVVLGELGPQVRQGCPGWLFLQEELKTYAQAEQALERRALMVSQARQLAAKRGISMYVVVVPDKSRIESARLCGLRRPLQVVQRYEAFTRALARRSISAVRLDQVLALAAGERYFRSDSHWNEHGAGIAAQAVVDRILRDSTAVGPLTQTLVFDHAPAKERVGDLVRLAGLDEAPPRLRPRGDWLSESHVRPDPSALGADLLGDAPPARVVVIGSSFSKTANFVEFVSAALRMPVANMAKEGGGFAGAAQAYFRNAAFLQSPPQAIIWEFPERVLGAPLGPEEKAWEAQLQRGSLF